ncbi:G1/S-specific cyclin-D3 [Halocaridina rubra]|uniref:G1/S-specific cyclin-D3 n=1 Tax=Halocaridina rubra TaxID=373956 RepID=A0AAN9A995_HALRR
MEELYCSEAPVTCTEGPVAEEDPRLLADARVLDNLVQLQHFTMPPQDYFKHIQLDIQPYMRKVVTRWMLDLPFSEVCETSNLIFAFLYGVIFSSSFFSTVLVRVCIIN